MQGFPAVLSPCLLFVSTTIVTLSTTDQYHTLMIRMRNERVVDSTAPWLSRFNVRDLCLTCCHDDGISMFIEFDIDGVSNFGW
jgi:hypothetical protein